MCCILTNLDAEPYELVAWSWDQKDWESLGGYFKLPCNVLRNVAEKKYYLLISMPGLKPGDKQDHVEISVLFRSKIDIRVTLPEFLPNQDCTRTNRTGISPSLSFLFFSSLLELPKILELKHGVGLVSHEFPPNLGFCFEKDYISCCKIDAGILVITLSMDIPLATRVSKFSNYLRFFFHFL
jgi:hypothetical protein